MCRLEKCVGEPILGGGFLLKNGVMCDILRKHIVTFF